MAKAKKLPSGQYRVLMFDYTSADKKRHYRSFTADTKSEAERQANEWKYGKNTSVPDITLEKAVNKYVDSKSAVLSPSTIRGYRTIARDYVAGSSIAPVKLSKLTNVKLQMWVSDLAGKVSPGTVHNAYGLITATLTQQIPDQSFRITLPTKVKKEQNTPTDAQVSALIQNASEHLRLAIMLSACGNGALRRGEVCAIKHADLDRKACTVRIHADFVRSEDHKWIYKDHPKTTASNRIVTYPKEVIDQIPIGRPDDYIVGMMPGTLSKEFRKLKEKLGFNFRFHDLRAYCASVMLSLGLPVRYVEQVGGWTPGSKVLESIYSRVLPDKVEEYQDKIVNHMKNVAECNTNATQEEKENREPA